MDEKRFHFIEVSDEGEPDNPDHSHLGPMVSQIPPRQFLTYHDLVSLKPRSQVLKKLSKKLIEKYRVIPLELLPSQMSFRLPNHLNNHFHSFWEAKSQLILYLAMCDVSQQHSLRILHNATGYMLYAIPLLESGFEQFLQEQYARCLKS